jgi:hypothetical protein
MNSFFNVLWGEKKILNLIDDLNFKPITIENVITN